ncbi:hypothetical protein CDV36_007950 [Fusarium kuroshium]|uniref:Protein kinase domain-containing protein n=1 Tax=Fusarium kuroshium TaxID=2010991 RepID=A0A3M2S5D1_9HYPO|nr:hypothetical protein CDV36_007950 [Fusarium kuroshium]
MAHPRRVGASIRAPQQTRRGSGEPLDLHELADPRRRPEALKRAVVSPTSPLSTLLHQQAKTLRDAVCCQLNFTQERASANLLVDLEAHLSAVQQHFLRFLILQEFHTRNPETGPLGGLNALFASRFILKENFDTGLIIQTPLYDANTRLHPRYIQTYQDMDDTRYNQNIPSKEAKGGFASVRKVLHKDTGEPLAMKTFFEDGDRAQILYEIGILEVCDHSNIPKLVEAFSMPIEDEDETIKIIMRPWAPFTLKKFLESPDQKRRARCPWFQPGSPESQMCIYKIMKQLTDAVVYLHRLSIKHKDIKPDNILLHKPKSSPPHAIIADVGVGKVLVRNGSTNYNKSTYEYLAPEQVSKKASGLPADVWQLGCCFAMLLAVSKAGTLGYDKLYASFWRPGEDCLCQIASEHEYFMSSFRDIYRSSSRADRAACSLVSSMLNMDHQDRINIEGVLASVEDLIRQASEGGGRGVTMAG